MDNKYQYVLFNQLAQQVNSTINSRMLTLVFIDYNQNTTQIGYILSINRIIQLLAVPVQGQINDFFKRSRDTQIAGQILCTIVLYFMFPNVLVDQSAYGVCFIIYSIQTALRQTEYIQDGLNMSTLNNDTELWTLARGQGAFAYGIGNFGISLIVEYFDDINIIYYFQVLSSLLTIISLFFVDVNPKDANDEKPENQLSTIEVQYRMTFKDQYTFSQILNMSVIFGGFSMVEQLLFIDLKFMDTSTITCGLTVMITVMFELPIFSHSKLIQEQFGVERLTILGQFLWIVRAMQYAFMTEGWQALFIEPLHGVTFGLIWVGWMNQIPFNLIRGHENQSYSLPSFLFFGLFSFFGINLGAWGFETVGPKLTFIFASLVNLVCMVNQTVACQLRDQYIKLEKDMIPGEVYFDLENEENIDRN